MRSQSPDFRNVCFPCSSGLTTVLQVSEEAHFQNDDSPCHSNRSSASSTTSVGKMDSKIIPSEKELTERLSLGIVQNVVLNVGTKAQLRRRNSSVSRRKSNRRTELINATTSPYIEEWSETFVAQDGVLTTNFCSTELWVFHWKRKLDSRSRAGIEPLLAAQPNWIGRWLGRAISSKKETLVQMEKDTRAFTSKDKNWWNFAEQLSNGP